MPKIIATVIFMFCVFQLRAQNKSELYLDKVPFNELDDKGRKHGYWKTFVDSNLTNLEDSTKATWFYYRLFNHGKIISGFTSAAVPEKDINNYNFQRPKIEAKVSPIDGTFIATWNIKSPMVYKLIFEKGHLIERHDILSPDGSNWDICKYDWKFLQNPYSLFYRKFHVWDKNKIRETYYYWVNGKVKKKKSSKIVESQNYFDNNEF